MGGLTPITQRDRALMAKQSIASQMPVLFANGNKWYEFKGECNVCHQEIPDHLVCGELTMPILSVAVVDAVGVCPSCKVAVKFYYRLHDDSRITGPRDGKWKSWGPDLTVWERILVLLGFHK